MTPIPDLTQALDSLASPAGFTAQPTVKPEDVKPEDVKPEDVKPVKRGRPSKDRPRPVKSPYVPVLDESLARELVISRIVEAEEANGNPIRSVRKFASDMYEIGVTDRKLSVATLYRLFTGQLYPKLTDRDGSVFNWNLVPRAKRGRRAGRCAHTSRVTRIEDQVRRMTSVLSHVCHKLGLPNDLAKDPTFLE